MVRSADPTQLLFMREVTALMKYLAAYRGRRQEAAARKMGRPDGPPPKLDQAYVDAAGDGAERYMEMKSGLD
jgi:hypothetical protein